MLGSRDGFAQMRSQSSKPFASGSWTSRRITSGESVTHSLERGLSVVGLAHDLEALRFEHGTRRGPEARVVVDDEDAGHQCMVANAVLMRGVVNRTSRGEHMFLASCNFRKGLVTIAEWC